MAFDYVPLWDKYSEILAPLVEDGDYAAIGRLTVAMMDYKAGKTPTFEGAERYIWPAIKMDIDHARDSYTTKSQNGKNGGRPKQSKEDDTAGKADESGEKQSKPSESEKKQTEADETTGKADESKTDNIQIQEQIQVQSHSPIGESIGRKGAPAPARKVKRKKLGKYGWVRLTEDEFMRLVADLGKDEVDRCIAYVDESAQSNGNKNKWTDWNVVIRKCSREGWGLRGNGRYGTQPQPQDNSESTGTSDYERMKKNLEELKNIGGGT